MDVHEYTSTVLSLIFATHHSHLCRTQLTERAYFCPLAPAPPSPGTADGISNMFGTFSSQYGKPPNGVVRLVQNLVEGQEINRCIAG